MESLKKKKTHSSYMFNTYHFNAQRSIREAATISQLNKFTERESGP